MCVVIYTLNNSHICEGLAIVICWKCIIVFEPRSIGLEKINIFILLIFYSKCNNGLNKFNNNNLNNIEIQFTIYFILISNAHNYLNFKN